MSSLQALKEISHKFHVVDCENNRVFISDFEKFEINNSWVHKRVEIVDVNFVTRSWIALDLLYVKMGNKYTELTTLGEF